MQALKKFSREQWHEFGLIIGLSLQDISDCQLGVSVSCNYQNTLLQKWLSTDTTASWHTVVTAVKAMLPPACDYADSIVQGYPEVAGSTEKELREMEDIIPPILVVLPHNEIPTVCVKGEELDVDEIVSNVSMVIDKRFRDIEEVLRASNEELKIKSKSEEYWKRQLQLDNELISALQKQNDEIEKLLERTQILCDDLFVRNVDLDRLINRVQGECKIITSMDEKVRSKKALFEEIHKQCIRLEILMSKNAERLVEICKIPSKINKLKEDANINHDMCNNAKKNVLVIMKRQHQLLTKYIDLLSSTQSRLSAVVKGMLDLLEVWAIFYATTQAAYGAAIGGTIGGGIALLAAWGLTVLTGGAGLPAVLFVSAAGVGGAAGGAAVGGIYGWSSYENQGRLNADIMRQQAEKSDEKRMRLTKTCTEISSKIEHQIRSL